MNLETDKQRHRVGEFTELNDVQPSLSTLDL
jgi:hypothetical protein